MNRTGKALVIGALAVSGIGVATAVRAQLPVGVWTRQEGPALPGTMTMTVEACCGSGRRLIYRMTGTDAVMTVESPLDGSEVPVLLSGKPSGETMAIKLVDPRHATTVLKLNGQPFGTSKATLSADGKTLTVENDFTATVGTNASGKSTETWVHK